MMTKKLILFATVFGFLGGASSNAATNPQLEVIAAYETHLEKLEYSDLRQLFYDQLARKETSEEVKNWARTKANYHGHLAYWMCRHYVNVYQQGATWFGKRPTADEQMVTARQALYFGNVAIMLFDFAAKLFADQVLLKLITAAREKLETRINTLLANLPKPTSDDLIYVKAQIVKEWGNPTQEIDSKKIDALPVPQWIFGFKEESTYLGLGAQLKYFEPPQELKVGKFDVKLQEALMSAKGVVVQTCYAFSLSHLDQLITAAQKAEADAKKQKAGIKSLPTPIVTETVLVQEPSKDPTQTVQQQDASKEPVQTDKSSDEKPMEENDEGKN